LRPWGPDTAGVLSFLAALPERHPGIHLRLLLGGKKSSPSQLNFSCSVRETTEQQPQVDPMKPTLKEPESYKRSKLKHDTLLSSFAYNFNLRHVCSAITTSAWRRSST